MAIRLPLQAVLSYNNATVQGGGPTSVNGGVVKQFTIPQDTDEVVVKYATSVLGGGASATLQTTDDGGTTWWDVARTSIVSNAAASNVEWLAVPVIGFGLGTLSSVVATGSVISFPATPGNMPAASSLGSRQISGLPILSPTARVFLRYTNAVTSVISEAVTVYVNSQAPSV